MLERRGGRRQAIGRGLATARRGGLDEPQSQRFEAVVIVTPWSPRRMKLAGLALQAALLKGKPLSADALNALARLGEAPDAIQARATQDTGRVIGHAMGVILRRGRLHWPQFEPLAEAIRADPAPSGLSREVVAYLTTARRLDRYIAAKGLERKTEDHFPPHLEALAGIVDQAEIDFPDVRALAILRAGVVSLTDRRAARDLYVRATALGPAGMASAIYDQGAHTYFSAAEVWSRRRVEDAPGFDALKVALKARPAPYDRPWMNIVWSVDPGFLRIYGPYWFNLAPYLMNEGIGLVMVVAGDPAKSAPVIAEARELIARTAWFHGLPDAESYAQAFAFVPVAVPDGVAEAKTFYASARYLMAPGLLRETGAQLMILDADQSLRDPIPPFVQALKGVDVGVTRSRGMAVLWPWRRNMAGTAWFSGSDASLAYLTRMRDYITAGLSQSPSWTLDQNAIAYALEQTPDARVEDLGARVRPLFQDRIRTVFEKTWHSGPATPP